MHRYTFVVLFFAVTCVTAFAQDSIYVAQHYQKRECYIPMRDGIRLFTVIYTPRDTLRSYPIMMFRTPYGVGPYGAERYPHSLGPSYHFTKEGFIFVYQDVRGRYMSEGEFDNMTPHKEKKSTSKDVDESSDTYDTIEWLLAHLRHNTGKIGMWGVSYPGFYTSASCINAHPAIAAISPQAPIADWFMGDDVHHNGAFFLLDNFGFSSAFDRIRTAPASEGLPGFSFPTSDAYDFFLHAGPSSEFNRKYFAMQVPFWDTLVVHSTYDYYWKARNLLPHLHSMPPAVLVVGGWFDAEDLYGTLHSYAAIERQNPGISNTLVMGPWHHGGWAWSEGSSLGDIRFGSHTSEYFRDSVQFPFFLHYLKGTSWKPLPEALAFETGTNRWRSYTSWPPKGALKKPYYLASGKRLIASMATDTTTGYDEYISDPSRPVPFEQRILNYRPVENLTTDQRFAANRTDVLTYETAPLSAPVTAAGPINVRLSVSTSGTDADWVVKVIDACPDSSPTADTESPEYSMTGYQMLVREDVMPSRFRTGFERQEPMVPGSIVPITFLMNDINHTFLPGHRIMVQVQSSLYPLVDRNPQKFLPLHHGTAADMEIATERVYHELGHISQIILTVMPEDGR